MYFPFQHVGKALGRFLCRTTGVAVYFVQCGCVAHCFFEYCADFVVCSGSSMEPTITSGDIIITEHISNIFNYYEKGDIIIARSPTNPRQHICKRITGLSGDRTRGKRIPRGHVWLEGDNKENSTDSRAYGPLPQALVRGRAVCKIWPLRDFEIFERL